MIRKVSIPWLGILALVTSALRLREVVDTAEEEEEGINVQMGATIDVDRDYQRGVLRSEAKPDGKGSEWPDTWLHCYEHGHTIAHMMPNQTLWDFVHAYTGPPPSYYEAQTRALPEFGIPALKMQHAVPGFEPRTREEAGRVTAFPSYLALAASWDRYLVSNVAMAVGEEFKTLGANVMFGPAINIHRATQHDREFDSLSGEDPTLGSILTRAWILAVQTHGIMSVPKYLGMAEQGPVHWENDTANLTSWDSYYPPFLQAIDVGAAGVMCASHEVNGLWSCRDKDLLERDLKNMMGFHGMVISDNGTARDYFSYASSFEQGLDLEVNEEIVQPWSEHMEHGMRRAAAHVLAAIWKMRLEDDKTCEPPCADDLGKQARTEEHLQVAKVAAASGIIILKNEYDLLPLDVDRVRVISVTGPAALGQKDYCNTDHRAPAKECETPASALKSHGIDKGLDIVIGETGAQACVVIGGTSSDEVYWEVDEQTKQAIDAATMNCPSVAVFLELSGAVLTPWRDNVQAIAVTFHSGEETAFAWAATLFGDDTPSGKLPISFPADGEKMASWWEEAVPSYWNPALKFAFPFGFGLSYAKFEYTHFKPKPACRFPFCCQVTVKNTGSRPGAEVVQVYFEFPEKHHHPTVLRGFHKTKVLTPGESEIVFFPFSYRESSLYHDVSHHAEKDASWTPVETINVLVGSSSVDIRGNLTIQPRR